MVGAAVAALFVLCERAADADEIAVTLAEGVKVVWDPELAYRDETATRERICINGLWRWQPAHEPGEKLPAKEWGYFKVPACWPGITDYLQKDCQTLFAHPNWAGERLRSVTAAWYQREITIPQSWRGRRIALSLEYLNSLAGAYVDGKPAGELRFPGGELDLTEHCRPGQTHMLSLLVTALPLKSVMLAHNDTNVARRVAGSVARRGLCGDVFLIGAPKGARITDVRVATSVRRGEISMDVALDQLGADTTYSLHASVTAGGRTLREFGSPAFRAGDLKDDRIVLAEKWKPEKLWDMHTPQNVCQVSLTLQAADGSVLTSASERFGFREFWIDGRDFFSTAAGSISAPCRSTTRRSVQPGPATTGPGKASRDSRVLASTSSTRTTTAANRGPILALTRSCELPTTSGCSSLFRSRTLPSTTGRHPMPTSRTAMPTTPSTTCGRRRTIPR
jgi:hypothetical protein